MKKAGVADLPLHHGRVPSWLAQRMSRLGEAIVEAIVLDYGTSEVLRRLSDPFWFQAFGCVLGMDWHSSGITTSVMGALKRALNHRSHELGLYVCGGRGKHSRATPRELLEVANRTGLDGTALVHASKLSAKIDNTAIQDGFQLYLHNFVVSNTGEWAVVQQGMNDATALARRYHWHSAQLESFVSDPHTAVMGHNQGDIINVVAKDAAPTRQGVLDLTTEKPDYLVREVQRLIMPRHHEVRPKDVNLKRLGSVLAVAQDSELRDFESVLMLPGVGPRTLQSLVLVSEVIHGTPSRFEDPARFAFAHGGKDGNPFPVPTHVFDETIAQLKDSLAKARLERSEKKAAIDSLTGSAQRLEHQFKPTGNLNDLIEEERKNSWKYGGRTINGFEKAPKKSSGDQLKISFD